MFGTIIKRFSIILASVAVLIGAGTVVPRPFWQMSAAQAQGENRRILVLSNPIHTDIAIPATPETLKRFAFLGDAGLDLGNPNLRYIVFGWGGRSFYTETPTWADLKALPVMKSFTLDRSVMHAELSGDIPSDDPAVTALTVSAEGFDHLLRFIRGSFADKTEKPAPLDVSYGENDAFFAAGGFFNALAGCNTWTAAALREAGLTSGWWTPLPPLLAASLRLHNSAGIFALR